MGHRKLLGLAATAALVFASVWAGSALAQADIARNVAVLVAPLPKLGTPATDIPLAPELARDMGFISSIAVDEKNGLTYVLQRGAARDPVIVVERAGKLVRSWGKGLFATPHSVRIAGDGTIWTTDSVSSTVLKFSPQGERLLTIEVGGQLDPTKTTGAARPACWPRCIAFLWTECPLPSLRRALRAICLDESDAAAHSYATREEEGKSRQIHARFYPLLGLN